MAVNFATDVPHASDFLVSEVEKGIVLMDVVSTFMAGYCKLQREFALQVLLLLMNLSLTACIAS